MQWTSSITEAVTQSRTSKTAMLILLEPPPTPESDSTTSEELLQALSTSSLHKFLFTDTCVQRLLSTARITCLRIVAGQNNPDYTSFKEFFTHSHLPDMLLVNYDGSVPWRARGYTSPRAFVTAVSSFCKIDTSDWFGPADRSSVLVLPGKPVKKSVPVKKTSTERFATSTTLSTPKKGLSLQGNKCALRVRLPSGRSVEREYTADTKFSSVRMWLSEQSNVPSKDLVISTAFPKHFFDHADDAKMISELGLLPASNLVVAVCERDTPEESNDRGGTGAGWGVGNRVYATMLGGRDVLMGFFGSFFGNGTDADAERIRDGVDREQRERRERENERRRGLDDDSLRYNGNSTQFGYDEDR